MDGNAAWLAHNSRIITITIAKRKGLICLNSRRKDVGEIVESAMTIVETDPPQVEAQAILTIVGQTGIMIVDMAEII